jgi:ubiquinone/menaquinone biosynthesis C-methylase UbiE
MTSTPAALSPEPLIRMIQGVQVTAILQAGLELGVFDRIAAGLRQPPAIAAAVGADERGTRILLDALSAIGLLERGEGRGAGYGLSPLADAFLVTGRPHYLGGVVDILASPWTWSSHQHMAEAVRRGGTPWDQSVEIPGHAFWETFAPASTGVARPAGQRVAELLAGWCEGRARLEILDVACGSGLLSLTLAARHPAARSTLLDWPNVLELARTTIDTMGLRERTGLIEGDAFTVPLGGPYDVIIASNVFHHFSEERCLTLLRRLRDVLEPDGRLVVQEFLSGPPPAEVPFPYLFSVRMLTATREGEAHSLDAYRRLLDGAGFAAPEVHAVQDMPSSVLVAGPAR